MNITILAIGSRGDVQPYLALSVSLQKAGHKVRLAVPPNFEAFVKDYGVAFAPLGEDIQAWLNTDQFKDALESGSMLTYMRKLWQSAARIIQTSLSQAQAACQDAELIIYNGFSTPVGYTLAEKNPALTATFNPITPPASSPPPVFRKARAWAGFTTG